MRYQATVHVLGMRPGEVRELDDNEAEPLLDSGMLVALWDDVYTGFDFPPEPVVAESTGHLEPIEPIEPLEDLEPKKKGKDAGG